MLNIRSEIWRLSLIQLKAYSYKKYRYFATKDRGMPVFVITICFSFYFILPFIIYFLFLNFFQFFLIFLKFESSLLTTLAWTWINCCYSIDWANYQILIDIWIHSEYRIGARWNNVKTIWSRSNLLIKLL